MNKTDKARERVEAKEREGGADDGGALVGWGDDGAEEELSFEVSGDYLPSSSNAGNPGTKQAAGGGIHSPVSPDPMLAAMQTHREGTGW